MDFLVKLHGTTAKGEACRVMTTYKVAMLGWGAFRTGMLCHVPVRGSAHAVSRTLEQRPLGESLQAVSADLQAE